MKYINIKSAILCCLAVMVSWKCTVDDKQNLPDRSYSLTWSDEFEGSKGQGLDATKWTYDIGNGDNGWGNQEFQYYTNRPENIALDGEGHAVITAKAEAFNGFNFTSARIKTQGLFSHQFGRVEARIKTPYGPGIWPAFWMLGANIDEVGWPQCGEIDIMEMRGNIPNINNGSLHGPGYSAGQAVTGSYGLTDNRFDNDFHVFAVEWGIDYIDYFVDDVLYQQIKAEDVPGEWVYNSPFFMILNIAVGGNYVGFPTVNTPFPQSMYIDYVRVYNQN